MTASEQGLPYFGAPPARTPLPAREVPALQGKRVILSRPFGFVYDVRAVSQVHDVDGHEVIEVVTEEDYFRWMFTGERPEVQVYPLHLVWVE